MKGTTFLSQGIMADKEKSILIDKDKSMLKACHGDPMPVDDKAHGPPLLPVGGDRKMKRKRSRGTMVNTTPSDGDQELKQRMQRHRHSKKPSPQSGNGLRFWTRSSNKFAKRNKMDGTSQMSVSSSRFKPRNDSSNGSLSNDKGQCPSGFDEEGVTAKGSNKMLS